MTGRYRLRTRRSSGGGVDVWHAEGAEGAVALKIATDEVGAVSIAREARIAALTLSPLLPQVVALGWIEVDGAGKNARTATRPDGARPFVALRWIEGSEPGTQRGDAARRLDVAVRVACDAGQALASLHALGVAHGDIKPANLVVDAEGRVHLLDLGLACNTTSREVDGGTPRYLALGDQFLGDGRARDLLALGVTLAEIAAPELVPLGGVLPAARAATLPEPIGTLCHALLVPDPTARPSARWVCDHASTFAKVAPPRWQASLVRATYLRIKWQDIPRSSRVSPEAPSWLAGAVTMAEAAGALTHGGRGSGATRTLEAMTPLERQRWLVALVGSTAAAWPLSQLCMDRPLALDAPCRGDAAVCAALEALAATRPPASWSLREVMGCVHGSPPSVVPRHAGSGDLDPASAADLAARLARVPMDVDAVEQAEQLGTKLPHGLALRAADALRLAGDLGRADGLVRGRAGAGALQADIARRAGDLEQAIEIARRALDIDADGRARACLARCLLDLGRADEALAACQPVDSAPIAEVAALVHAHRGERARALEQVELGLALATDEEARARLRAAAAYVQSGVDPRAARAGYGAAVEHAARAGASLEEASYRTGEAAACVDLGEIDAAIATASRAALLWEHALGRPAMAARAELACAAAYACVGDERGARHHALRSIALATTGGDVRARAFGWLCVADACDPGTVEGRAAAVQACELLCGRDALGCSATASEDVLAATARVLRHEASPIQQARVHDLDALARPASGLSAEVRLAWWQARAERLLSGDRETMAPDDVRAVLTALCALAGAPAPVAAQGWALHAGERLAALAGDTTARARLGAARREAAARVLAGHETAGDRAPAAAWLGAAGVETDDGLPGQSSDLRNLVRALGEHRKLGPLLDRVLDVLLGWTGAARGLVLLRNPRGELVPRAARNIARDKLVKEQLAVSKSLAERASATGEPVVAVDAMHELAESHRSVHSLKLRSVLAVPLVARGENLGVVYLDDRMRSGAFGPKELAWAQAAAPVAALAIADALAQVRLRRALRRAERASSQLQEVLARKETALDVAERELARVVEARATRHRYDDVVGASEPIARMLAVVDRVAASDVPVLLRGESGTGKEIVARAIHTHSARATRPFVSENCGALPEPLLESALFGHVRGAFTGAHAPRVGLFEAAHGGTLFLDEIGEMGASMQTKLLRVLEDGMVRPLGSERAHRVDVRIVAATHRDLERMVSDGSFREDLYYRIDVISIPIPTLRERPSDIPLLVHHFIRKHAAREVGISALALARLQSHPWPGNVRQLENEIRRALVLCDDRIDVPHLSLPHGERPAQVGLDVRTRIDDLESSLVAEALKRTSGNQTQAAKLLGLSRFGLHKMIRRLQLDPKSTGREAPSPPRPAPR